MWGWNCQMWEKNWGITKCDKITIKCDVGTVQCDDETVKCEKNKGTTKCDKRTITCDVRIAQCKDETIKFDILVTWYSRLPTNEYYTPKAKGLFIKLKYLKISSIDLKKRCKDKKWSNVINCKKPNEKFQRYVIIFLWEIIYVHFYDWDRSLDLVLFVYDLIELIIKASL